MRTRKGTKMCKRPEFSPRVPKIYGTPISTNTNGPHPEMHKYATKNPIKLQKYYNKIITVSPADMK